MECPAGGVAADLPDLPTVHQVARTVRGEGTAVSRELTAAIVDELAHPSTRVVA